MRAIAVVLAAGVTLSTGSAAARTDVDDPIFPALGNSGYNAKHYDIALSWFAGDGSIDATMTMTARARRSMSSFSLDLAGLSVSEVRVNGAVATPSRKGHKLVITPATPIAKGTTFIARVRYGGQPKKLVDADGSSEGWIRKNVGVITLNEPRGSMTWFPNNNTPSDKATFDLAIKVRSEFQAISNGRNTAVVPSGSDTTWYWSVTEPMATYLATIDIGKFTRQTRTIDGVRYDSFIAKGLRDNAEPLRLMPAVIRFGERYFGRYPFADAGMIVDNPPVFYALELQNRPFFPGNADTQTLVHELAHQWFGDSVTPRTWKHIWLNEGFATYAEWLWKAKHGGPSTHRAFRKALRETRTWSPAPARITAGTLFDEAVYVRGAMTLQALRERVGTRVFFRIVKRWAAQHRHANGTTHAFHVLAERVSGSQLDKLFRDWLYVEKKPRGYAG